MCQSFVTLRCSTQHWEPDTESNASCVSPQCPCEGNRAGAGCRGESGFEGGGTKSG